MGHMEYIRKTYNVPAKRGARIEFSGDETAKFIQGFLYQPKRGTIVSARGGYIRVKFDGYDTWRALHPTWRIKYV
jgi:hypothetical protein